MSTRFAAARWFCTGLLAVLLAGCSTAGSAPTTAPTPAPTSAPWPDDWLSGVCHGQRYLTRARTHLFSVSDQLDAYDVDAAGKELTAVASDATEALERFASATVWAPGKSLLVYLTSAATAIRKAANLAKLMLAGDLSAKADFNAQLAVYKRADERAGDAQMGLASRYGMDCGVMDDA